MLSRRVGIHFVLERILCAYRAKLLIIGYSIYSIIAFLFDFCKKVDVF